MTPTTQPQQQQTIVDLGQKVKAKYPGAYDDLEDAEVGRRIKAKYPGSYDDFVDAPTTTDRPSQPPKPSAVSRFASSLAETTGIPQMVREEQQQPQPTGFLDAVKQGVKRSITDSPPSMAYHLGKAIAQGAGEQFGKALKAAKQGDIPTAAARAVYGAVPIAGPTMAHAAEQMGRGDVAGGLGTATGAVAQLAAPEITEGIGKLAGRTSEAVSNIGKVDPVRTMIQAVKPRSTALNFPQVLERAMPEMKASEAELGKPIASVDDALKAAQLAKRRIRAQFDEAAGPARAIGSTVDLTPVADKMVASIPDKVRLENPRLAKRIEATAAKYRNRFPVEQVEDFLKTANAELDSYYGKYPAAQRAAAASNPDIAATSAQAQELRKALYSTLDSDAQGAAPRELNRRYGSVLQLEEELQRRKMVAMRQQPESLSEQVGKWAGYGEMAKGALKTGTGVMTANPSLALSGAADVVGGATRRAVAKWLKEQQTTDALIRRSFENFNGAPQPVQMPTAPTPKGLLNKAPIVTPPPPDATSVRVTTGPQLTGRMITSGTTKMPPPPDTSGPIVGRTPGQGADIGARTLPPPSRVQTGGFAVSSFDLVPVKHPVTGQIEYVPKWTLQKPPIMPPPGQ